MTSVIKIGDVVELNSGGISTTVVNFQGDDQVIVVYFDSMIQEFKQYKLHKDSVKLKEVK